MAPIDAPPAATTSPASVWGRALRKCLSAWLLGGLGWGFVFLTHEKLQSDLGHFVIWMCLLGLFLAGGTLGGSKVGIMGWSWLIVGALGLTIGSHLESQQKDSPPWSLLGVLIGAHLGLAIGVIIEAPPVSEPKC